MVSVMKTSRNLTMPTHLPDNEVRHNLRAMEREIAITSECVFASRRAIAEAEALIERVDRLLNRAAVAKSNR